VVDGARLWRAGAATVLVVDRPRPDRLLAGLRARRLRRVDVLVLRRPGPMADRSVQPLLERLAVGVVVAPGGSRLAGATTAVAGMTARAGELTVSIDDARAPLAVHVARLGRSPPPTISRESTSDRGSRDPGP
jgi:hypothetical protein